MCGIWEFVVAIGDFKELYDIWWGLVLEGAWLSVGAPGTYSMSGLSLARHVHGIVGHVY